jgi:hypothetical protein
MERISHFWAENHAVRYAQAGCPMSALGHKQTFNDGIETPRRYVRFVPKAEVA